MKGKFQTDVYIKFVIYCVVVVLINIAGITLFKRFDLTENKIYSLSDASKQVVSTLSEPLTINVFFTENLPAPHNNTKRYLLDILDEYAIHANKYFNFRFYDVSPNEEGVDDKAKENRQLAEDYGIYPVEIRLIEKDEIKFKKAYMGLALIHGDIIEQIPAITSTSGLEYRLTTAIEKLNNKISTLVSLEEKVKIKLIMSSSLKLVAPFIGVNELPDLPNAVKDAVGRLNDKNYGQLTFEHIDPLAEPEINKLQEDYNIMALKWPAMPERNIQAGTGGIGLVMEHGDNQVEVTLMSVLRIPLIGTRYELVDIGTLEDVINENIETLIGINEDIGYLADHGTLTLGTPMMMMNNLQQGEQLQSFQGLISETYTLKQINLKDERIPESLNSLIIAQPVETFTDYELFQIDQALMRGTNIAIFSDAFREVPQPPQQQFSFNRGPSYQPLYTGLEKLLDHYGAKIKPSFIMDKACYKQAMPSRAGGGERPIYFAPMIKNENINQNLNFLKNIKGLVTMNNSPVSLDNDKIKESKLKAHQLLASSAESWEMKGQINLNPLFIQPPQDGDFKSYPIAYLIEGNFPSYFKGKEIPTKEIEEDANEGSEDLEKKDAEEKKKAEDIAKIESQRDFIDTGRPGRLCIIGSSALLKDNLIDQEGRSPNSVFLLNLFDKLNNRDAIAQMRSKTQEFNPLEDTEGITKNFVKLFNIAGLPVLVVIFGLITWLRRKARRKNIALMFQK